MGVAFSIPDLSQFGLTFEGGRLLVAAGKPVAQLMYRLQDGTVIALCLQSSPDALPAAEFQQRTIKGVRLYILEGGRGKPMSSSALAVNRTFPALLLWRPAKSEQKTREGCSRSPSN